jgi:hypothetical protein
MEHNKIEINKFIAKNKNLIINKIKKNNIQIKEGIITFNVSLNPLSCAICTDNNLCIHKIFVLKEYLKLDLIVIAFFHKITDKFYENIKNSNVNDILNEHIQTEILEDECGICFDKLNKLSKSKCSLINEGYFYQQLSEIYECTTCTKYCHMKCIQKWKNADKNNVTCIYCKN